MSGRHFRQTGILFCILLFLVLQAPLLRSSGADSDKEFVKNLGPGWNLGNSLDCYGDLPAGTLPADYETMWNNPLTTRELFREVRSAGFRTVRIPVTWFQHLGPAAAIDSQWLDRVVEVVDYALDEDLYVILDLHHENWTIPTYENRERGAFLLSAIWAQLADRFQDYDERLIFECMNEPRLVGTEHEWTDGTAEAYEVLNGWNQLFVDTIRNRGGFNPRRYLLLPTYCNRPTPQAAAGFVLPRGERLIVTVHLYSPYSYTLQPEGTREWNAGRPEDTAEIDRMFNTMEAFFISKGVPVLLGEFGALDKGNEENRAQWAGYMAGQAARRQIPYVWWDDGGTTDSGSRFGLIDRNQLTWRFPAIADALTDSYEDQ